MENKINMIYGTHPGEPALHYQGPEGTAWVSNKRNENAYNIFMDCEQYKKPKQGDCAILNEPITVRPDAYNIDHLQRFHKVFGCFDTAFENSPIKDKFTYVNYGSDLNDNSADNIRNNWKSWEERKNAVIIVAGPKSSNHYTSIYALREMLADFFHENGIEVAWFGGIPGNKPKPYFKGFVENKIAEINKYRFHICIENTYDPIYSRNYLTEKLPQGIYGGAVPLYMGCYNIDQFAPENSYFDLRRFIENKTEIMKKSLLYNIKSFSKEDFEKYQNAAYNWMKDPTGLFYHTDMKRMYIKILNALNN